MTKKPTSNIYDVQISAIIGLEVEAMNGIGSVGNVSQTSKVTLSDRTVHDMTKGTMLSHQLVNKIYEQVHPDELCEACRVLSPLRVGDYDASEEVEALSKTGNYVKQCIICDSAGFMNAEKNKVAKRSKPQSFSAMIGIEPHINQTVTRSRIDNSENGGKKKEEDSPTNSTQMIMQQQVRSNDYAVNFRLNLGRIAFDDERLLYVTDDVDELVRRMRVNLLAARNLLMDMKGAKNSVFSPQMTRLEGVITTRKNAEEILSGYSPMKENYVDVHKSVNASAQVFKSPVDLKNIFDELIDEDKLREIAERNLRYTGQLTEE